MTDKDPSDIPEVERVLRGLVGVDPAELDEEPELNEETFVYLFRNDSEGSGNGDLTAWNAFIDGLRRGGHFVGGGPLGEGCVRKGESTIDEVSGQLAGYMVVTAECLKAATALLDKCPVILGGGSVEVRRVSEV